jgi:hypothetical protein
MCWSDFNLVGGCCADAGYVYGFAVPVDRLYRTPVEENIREIFAGCSINHEKVRLERNVRTAPDGLASDFNESHAP